MGFDGTEVLHFVAGAAAEVLHPPVEQPRKEQLLDRRPTVVIRPRVHRGAGAGDVGVLPAGDDFALGAESEGDEHRGPVDGAVRCRERPAQRSGAPAAPWAARPHPPCGGWTARDAPSRSLGRRRDARSGLTRRAQPGRPRCQGRRRWAVARAGRGSRLRGASIRRTAASAADEPAPHTVGTSTPGWSHTAAPRWSAGRFVGR